MFELKSAYCSRVCAYRRRSLVNTLFGAVACHNHDLRDESVLGASTVMVLLLPAGGIKNSFNILSIIP